VSLSKGGLLRSDESSQQKEKLTEPAASPEPADGRFAARPASSRSASRASPKPCSAKLKNRVNGG
jgi:hypothetical protein